MNLDKLFWEKLPLTKIPSWRFGNGFNLNKANVLNIYKKDILTIVSEIDESGQNVIYETFKSENEACEFMYNFLIEEYSRCKNIRNRTNEGFKSSELLRKLKEIDIPQWRYNITGLALPDILTLLINENQFEVSQIDERGIEIIREIFNSEEEACAYMFDYLRDEHNVYKHIWNDKKYQI